MECVCVCLCACVPSATKHEQCRRRQPLLKTIICNTRRSAFVPFVVQFLIEFWLVSIAYAICLFDMAAYTSIHIFTIKRLPRGWTIFTFTFVYLHTCNTLEIYQLPFIRSLCLSHSRCSSSVTLISAYVKFNANHRDYPAEFLRIAAPLSIYYTLGVPLE